MQGGSITHDEFDTLLKEASQIASSTLQEREHNITFTSERYSEKKPHPENQEAFTISVQFPWQKTPLTKIMVEITVTEIVYLPVQERPILHNYDEELEASLKVYCLEEVICEKISALLSFSKKLHERGWGRSRARDYYDLWKILGTYMENLDKELIVATTPKKCLRKSIEFLTIDKLFEERLMEDLNTSWGLWLAPLVPNCPDKDQVIKELKTLFSRIFPET